MESSSQDKHLPATQRKLDQARRDGQAARSKDLSHLAVVGTGAGALLLLAPSAFDHLRSGLAQALVFNARSLTDPGDMITRLVTFSGLGLIACMVFAAIVIAAVVLSAVAAGGWVASTKSITPDLNRLNPLSGLANLLSKQQLANVAKLVLLSAVLAAVGWMFLASSIDTVVGLILQPSPSALRALGDWLVSGVGLALLVVVAAAVVDVPPAGLLPPHAPAHVAPGSQAGAQGGRRQPARQGPHAHPPRARSRSAPASPPCRRPTSSS